MNDFIIFFLLFLTSGFFSGTETAFTALSEFAYPSDKDKRTKVQNIIVSMLDNKKNVIAAILIGNNIINTALAVYAGVIVDDHLVDKGLINKTAGSVLASFIAIVFLLIFGEVMPKQLGMSYKKGWMNLAAYPLKIVMSISKPVIYCMDVLNRIVFKLFSLSGGDDDAPTTNEIVMLTRSSEQAGHIDTIEEKLIIRSTNFNDITAREIMIPRNSVAAVPSNISYDELMKLYSSELYSRVPVYEGNIDHITGIFNYKEMLRLQVIDKDNFKIEDHMFKALCVPENIHIGKAFAQMKASRIQMAAVIDEFGSTSGIITMEDIMERIFGVINDEYDVVDDSNKADNDVVSGSITLHDLTKIKRIEFPDEIHDKYSTLNGLLTGLKGEFTTVDDEITWKKYCFKVLSVENRCAEKVLIKEK